MCDGSRGGVVGGLCLDLREFDRLHHLTEQTVREQHDGHSVLFAELKCTDNEVHDLLHGIRRKDDEAEIAVAEALCCLPVILLGGLNGTETRAAALNIDEETWNIRTCDIGDTLGFQRDSGRGGGCHDAGAGAACAENHIDRCDLRFSLKKDTAALGHLLGEILGKLGLRGDRVAKEALAACTDRGLGQRLIAFH